jgi:hypothetical protein
VLHAHTRVHPSLARARCPIVCPRLSRRPSVAPPALQARLYPSLQQDSAALIAFESALQRRPSFSSALASAPSAAPFLQQCSRFSAPSAAAPFLQQYSRFSAYRVCISPPAAPQRRLPGNTSPLPPSSGLRGLRKADAAGASRRRGPAGWLPAGLAGGWQAGVG